MGSAAQHLSQFVHLGLPQVFGVLDFVFVFGEVRDDQGVFACQFVHPNSQFEKGVEPFFFSLEPPEFDEFILFLGHQTRRFLTSVPEENVNVLFDVDIITKPLSQARWCADAVEQHAFGTVEGDFKLEFHDVCGDAHGWLVVQ